MSNRASFTSWGARASLSLDGHLSSDGVMTIIPYRVDVLLHQSFLPYLLLLDWLKLNLTLIVRSVDTG